MWVRILCLEVQITPSPSHCRNLSQRKISKFNIDFKYIKDYYLGLNNTDLLVKYKINILNKWKHHNLKHKKEEVVAFLHWRFLLFHIHWNLSEISSVVLADFLWEIIQSKKINKNISLFWAGYGIISVSYKTLIYFAVVHCRKFKFIFLSFSAELFFCNL